MASGALAAALGRMARAVSETLELKDVFARVADAAAAVLPFDTMVVFRLEGPGTYALYSFEGIVGEKGTIRLEDFSPAIRPRTDPPDIARRVERPGGRARPELCRGPTRWKRKASGRSSTCRWCAGRELAGYVGVGARHPGAFTAEHEVALEAIAGLLGLALEHERLWTLDTARRRRLDAIDALLRVLAESLDVREIFNRVSEVVQPVLPHDRLVLTSLSPDRRVITIDARVRRADVRFPDPAARRRVGCVPAGTGSTC